MNKQKILTTCLLFLVIIQSYGQLSGYYTIGGSNADYQTLALGLTDLYSQGINGDVIFALNSGTHSCTTFTSIPGASDNNGFTMQSATLDSTDVNFNQTIGFYEASYITIKAITITATKKKAIDFTRSIDIKILNCRINSTYDQSHSEGTVKIRHFASGNIKSNITINQCVINNTLACVSSQGSEGITTINNCELNSSERYSVLALFTTKFYIYNSSLNGGINSKYNIRLKNNQIIGKLYLGHADSVINNHFICDESFFISSNYFKDNIFEVSHVSNSYGKIYINNYYEGSINVSSSERTEMIGNVFNDDVHIISNSLLFEKNTVYGNFDFGKLSHANWDYRLYNNIFIGGYVRGGHHAIVTYNNFVDSAYLHVNTGDAKVYDNNFCRGIGGNTSRENIYHNNYFPLIYCPYDTISTHYDPAYQPNNQGIATNPILQGKGMTDAPSQDYLGNQRKTPTAMGANDIYICSDSSNNNITVPCGEELFLNICNVPDTGDFLWAPDSCVLHPDSLYTSLHAYNDLTLYLNNSIYGLIDSVTIQTEQFQVEIAEIPIVYCGYARTLNATFHPNADYHWTPEEGLNNPYIRNPSLLLEDTINLQYMLECQIDSCSTSYDTVNIDFDPLPNVSIHYPNQSFDTVFFTCYSTCTDEYLWDFGDGTYSNLENSPHVYQENGYYIITLTGTNNYGSRSRSLGYYFYSVSTPNYKINERVQIYPNPANEKLMIEGLTRENETKIQIFNSSGIEILKTKVNSEKAILNISEFKNGLYIIFISTTSEVTSKRVIVIH